MAMLPLLFLCNPVALMQTAVDVPIRSATTVEGLNGVMTAREISSWSYCKMMQNVGLAVMFNGIGVPVAATGLIHPIWAMAAMVLSVTAIFYNALRGRPRIFFDAVLSMGRTPARLAPEGR